MKQRRLAVSLHAQARAERQPVGFLAVLPACIGFLLCLAFVLYGDLAAAWLNESVLGDQRRGGAEGSVAEQLPDRVPGGLTPAASPQGAGFDARPAPIFPGGGR